jgi:hypothetical protein
MELQQRLQNSLSSYLSRSTIGRTDLKKAITTISARLPNTIIFGGMVREFALGRVRQFSSDIDLVSMHSRDEIHRAVTHHNPTLNKFGGFRFTVDKQRFDIWSFSDTWAFKQGHVSGEIFPDILKTTFFNLDAAYYHISRRELELIDGYAIWVSQKKLDINLRENPHPSNICRRAITLAVTKQLGISKNLAEFILTNIEIKTATWVERLFVGNLQKFLKSPGASLFYFSPQREINSFHI